ncbi:hypothetical protein [Mastigocoleus sp. MO_188.B34]|uniref:hypothetical protein n=1 Tax=Mastigocoleus sp. MO_188.B34 TaxID=3036635 RepID=UPI00260CE759|nr:hypothetical protein [Mastigocoleus sp. MO_188.B34]
MWVKTSVGAVAVISLVLAGVRFNIRDLIDTVKFPEQVSNPKKEYLEMKILVLYETNKNPIENVEVKLIVSNGSPATKKTDDNGYVSFIIPKEIGVTLFFRKQGFKNKNKTWNRTIDPERVNIYYLTPE